MKKFIIFVALLLSAIPASAQWQVPAGSVPIGKGPGIVGFGSVPTTNVKALGASGSAQSTTGTISALSRTLILTSAIDFTKSQGILINHAGPTTSVGVPTVNSVAAVNRTGATSYVYRLASVDAQGGVSAATAVTGGTTAANGFATLGTRLSDLAGIAAIDVKWTLGSGSPYCTAIWRSRAGAAFELLGCFQGTYIQDRGVSIQSIFWIPALPPDSALARWLTTTISDGAGTTTLTLAAAATTTATLETVFHDDTTAINAAQAVGNGLFFPCGTYNVRELLISVRAMYGEGAGCSIISGITPDLLFGQYGTVMVGLGTSDTFTFSGLSVRPRASMAAAGLVVFQGSGISITNSEFQGSRGVWLAAANHATVADNYISAWWDIGIYSGTSTNTIIGQNQIKPITGEIASDDHTGHYYPFGSGIVANGGVQTLINGNNIRLQGAIWGVNCTDSVCHVSSNKVLYTGRECITIGGPNSVALGNSCFWAAAGGGNLSSFDFGISTSDPSSNIVIDGNSIINSLYAAIGVYGTGSGVNNLSNVTVSNNTFAGAVQLAAASHKCGVNISGSNTFNVYVINNTSVSPTGFMTYLVCEETNLGTPDFNIVGIQNGTGATGIVKLLGTGSYWYTAPAHVICAVPPCTY